MLRLLLYLLCDNNVVHETCQLCILMDKCILLTRKKAQDQINSDFNLQQSSPGIQSSKSKGEKVVRKSVLVCDSGVTSIAI